MYAGDMPSTATASTYTSSTTSSSNATNEDTNSTVSPDTKPGDVTDASSNAIAYSIATETKIEAKAARHLKKIFGTITKEDVIIAGVEGGGTGFKIAIAKVMTECSIHNKVDCGIVILDTLSIPVTIPSETLALCANHLQFINRFLSNHITNTTKYNAIRAIGICCFGPLGVNPSKGDYGTILSGSPKKEWRGVDILSPLLAAVNHVPHALDTDVNAPAMSEYQQYNSSSTSK